MIKIGSSTFSDIRQLRQTLKHAKKRFPRLWLKALDDVADIAQKYFARQFSTEGGEFGKRWAPLAPGTNEDRVRKGYRPAHPILVRRGWLRASVISKSSAHHKRSITIRGIKMWSSLKTKSGHNLLMIHEQGGEHLPRREIRKPDTFISRRGWQEIRTRFVGMFVQLRREMEAV